MDTLNAGHPRQRRSVEPAPGQLPLLWSDPPHEREAPPDSGPTGSDAAAAQRSAGTAIEAETRRAKTVFLVLIAVAVLSSHFI